MFRGVLEFVGSVSYLVSLKIAVESKVNQGICSSIITLAGLLVTVMSYIAYKEKLNFPQLVGMMMVLIAIVVMGFF